MMENATLFYYLVPIYTKTDLLLQIHQLKKKKKKREEKREDYFCVCNSFVEKIVEKNKEKEKKNCDPNIDQIFEIINKYRNRNQQT